MFSNFADILQDWLHFFLGILDLVPVVKVAVFAFLALRGVDGLFTVVGLLDHGIDLAESGFDYVADDFMQSSQESHF